jgi:hypothetical protein
LRTDQHWEPDVFYRVRKRRSHGRKHAKCGGSEHRVDYHFLWAGRNQCQPVSNNYAAVEYFYDEHNHDDYNAEFNNSEHHYSGRQQLGH